MVGGQHRNDELPRVERVGCTQMKESAAKQSSNKGALPGTYMGVRRESKRPKKKLLTRPPSLEMTDYQLRFRAESVERRNVKRRIKESDEFAARSQRSIVV